MRIFVLVIFICICLAALCRFMAMCLSTPSTLEADPWDVADLLVKTGLAIWAGIVLWG